MRQQKLVWCCTLRVVMLSSVCMMLAAMACINWALGYAVAAVLVPVVGIRGQGIRCVLCVVLCIVCVCACV